MADFDGSFSKAVPKSRIDNNKKKWKRPQKFKPTEENSRDYKVPSKSKINKIMSGEPESKGKNHDINCLGSEYSFDIEKIDTSEPTEYRCNYCKEILTCCTCFDSYKSDSYVNYFNLGSNMLKTPLNDGNVIDANSPKNNKNNKRKRNKRKKSDDADVSITSSAPLKKSKKLPRENSRKISLRLLSL